MRVAVLDLGSNTFHLLVAQVDAAGRVERLDGAKRVVRLGAGLLAGGVLEESAWDRGLGAVGALLERAARTSGCRVVAVATSAVREAADGGAFVEAIERRHGVRVEVLDSDDEARLVYAGARSALPPDAGRIAVIDVGGGSVELAVGDVTADGAAGEADECLYTASRPLGVLRLLHACIPGGGPMRYDRVLAVVSRVRAGLAGPAAAVRDLAPREVVLTAGTARAIGRLVAPDCEGPRFLGRDEAVRLAAHLAQLSPAARQALGVEEARADTIAVGALAIATLIELLGVDRVRISDRALREGVALREHRRVNLGLPPRAAPGGPRRPVAQPAG